MGGAGENGNGGGGIQPSGVAKVLYSVARISVWWDIENYQVLELDLIMFLQALNSTGIGLDHVPAGREGLTTMCEFHREGAGKTKIETYATKKGKQLRWFQGRGIFVEQG
ncbi:uncharacterized protein LOC107867513 isoform X2 [Capsicum annuum]|uniref:uncharacterized protein LOC107867513 isoform X2 n=1 Tax=Capsicum annuum TaxID=4072 RepID=UPI001FB127B7|nr:uncharacterized protein LOC107867513 isoform X2 [Capsicum annuum]